MDKQMERKTRNGQTDGKSDVEKWTNRYTHEELIQIDKQTEIKAVDICTNVLID